MGFLTFLIQGLPLIGRAFTSFDKYQENKMNAAVETTKINGQVDLGVIQARAELAKVMKDDPATKFGRWFFIVPTGLFYTGCVWDSTGVLRDIYKLGMLELPGWIQYMPYAVVAYLFVSAWRK
jgi:hypothetical protein